ncbi:uncharacterized protein LOC112557177 isoform X1 [Pomacea canaliculata]|uniref:uncharacterized protein LOC112557177 isoform X1 n=1 Tax=Pomacea canaliculata TaxID=400727 RepID=UPI000D73D25E|nr:uncharacterized protein LOC112557177 isoform X1 [Pomacea canaliculata]
MEGMRVLMAACHAAGEMLLCATILCIPIVVAVTTVAPPSDSCEETFTKSLFECFTNSSVPFNTYLWAVSNGSGGIPPDNRTVFREHMCSVEETVVTCCLDSLHALVNSSRCRTVKGLDELLTSQVKTIFEEYDNYCAHECRLTLENNMRKCYSNFGLDPALFLPKSADGAILGKSHYDVDLFCSKQEVLVACITNETQACPEADRVLRNLGLDLGVMAKGLRLLCQRQEDYLHSLDCFSTQTRAVEKCLEDSAQSLTRLYTRARSEPDLTQEKFISGFCLDRVSFVKCDLTAWSEKDRRQCDLPALTLKRDVHCVQIPEVCKQILRQPVEQLCTWTWAAPPPQQIAKGDAQSETMGVLVMITLMTVVQLIWSCV